MILDTLLKRFAVFEQRRYLLFGLCFVAYVLRLLYLGTQSLWYDEGFSAWLAAKSFDEIAARTAADIHPPLFYWGLHLWTLIAGQSEFSLRFFSLIPSVLSVLLFFWLTRRLLDELTAWVATALATIAPAYIWYAQEARMYAWLLCLTIAATYCLLRWIDRPNWINWIGLIVCNLLAVYLHFFAFFIIAFQFSYFTIWWVRQETRWGILLTMLGSVLLIGIGYWPWMRFVFERLQADQSYYDGTLRLGELLSKPFLLFTVGHSWLEADATAAALLFLLLALFGWFMLGRIRTDLLESHDDNPFRQALSAANAARIFLFLYWVLPFVLLYTVSYARPKFHPRYLLMASPPFYILIAAGIAAMIWVFWRHNQRAIRRRYVALTLAAAISVIVLSVSLSAINNLYFDPRFSKDDFRAAIATIKANRAANEPTILVSGHMFPIYEYYDPQGQYIRLPDEPTLNVNRVLGYNVANDLNVALKGKAGAWVLSWQQEVVDPNNFVTTILDTQAKRQPIPQSFWGVELAHFQLAPNTVFSDKPTVQNVLNVNFGNQIELIGYNTPATPSPADKGLSLTLYWRSLDNLRADYNVALRVRDADGHLVGQLDARPGNYNYPTFRWAKDYVLFGNFSVPLEPGTPQGAYEVEVGLYEKKQEQVADLDVLDRAGNPAGRFAFTKPIPIDRPSKQPKVDDLKLKKPQRFSFVNQLEMLGVEQDRDALEPGEPVNVTIYWRAVATPRQNYILSFVLRGEESNETSAPVPLLTGLPTTQWRQGDIMRAHYTYFVPVNARVGERTLSVSLLDVNQKSIAAPAAVGTLRVNASTRSFTAPTLPSVPAFRPNVMLGGVAQLYGLVVSPAAVTNSRNVPLAVTLAPGNSMRLTLYWRATQVMRTSYTAFVHVRRDGAPILAQRDSIPVGGARPTTTWVPGEFITDSYDLVIPATAQRGDYSIEVGLYDARTGQRVPIGNSLSANPGAETAVNLNLTVSVR